jgi:hypothetical protein
MQVLLHNGCAVSGWRSAQIHQALLATFGLSAQHYGLNQLRYDLRKLKGHGLLECDGKRYAYRLTDSLFPLSPAPLRTLANSLFHHRPDVTSQPKSKLEVAFYRADSSIANVIKLLEAA